MKTKAKDRITVMIDSDIKEKLNVMRADGIKKTQRNVSFSQVLNDVLRKGLSK